MSDPRPAPGAPAPCVIAATDRSQRSAQVAARAAQVARVLALRLIVAHVEGGAEVAEPIVGTDERLLQGQPDEALLTLVRAEAAALLVLGLHRPRRVLDVLRLTTMERLVLAAPCPVLIAHQPAGAPYAQVLALSDFSPASAASLVAAGRIAPRAEFHVIHALQMRLGTRAEPGHREFETAMDRAILARDRFLATPGLPALAEAPEIVPGGVHEVLEFRRAELGADLVCIGAHSGRLPGELGNYARDLMRAPPTDLLVAKPGQMLADRAP